MPRSERLLDLIQRLRSHRYPVTGAVLARDPDGHRPGVFALRQG